MAIKTETLLSRNLTEVFGEPDATKRKGVIAELWNGDGVFVDPFGRVVGRGAINESVSHLHQKFPGFVFTPIGSPEAFHDIGRFSKRLRGAATVRTAGRAKWSRSVRCRG